MEQGEVFISTDPQDEQIIKVCANFFEVRIMHRYTDTFKLHFLLLLSTNHRDLDHLVLNRFPLCNLTIRLLKPGICSELHEHARRCIGQGVVLSFADFYV
jgi:hypothetical protein